MHVRLVSIPVADVDRAKRFYVELLGFEERFDGPFGDGQRWVELGLPGDRVAIALVTWLEAMPPGAQQGLVLHADDVHAEHARLTERGVELDAVVDEPWGSSSSFSDPDGNRWVLMQPAAADGG